MSFWIANFAALTSVAGEGTFSELPDETVDVFVTTGVGAATVDIVCRSSGKGCRNFYAIFMLPLSARIESHSDAPSKSH